MRRTRMNMTLVTEACCFGRAMAEASRTREPFGRQNCWPLTDRVAGRERKAASARAFIRPEGGRSGGPVAAGGRTSHGEKCDAPRTVGDER